MTADEHRERQYRDRGKITRVFRGEESHGIETVTIYIEGESWGQGFGMLAHKDAVESAAFLDALCRVFGLKDRDDRERLVGAECYALRYFPYLNEPIAALESVVTGRRFVIDEWRRQAHPDKQFKAPLHERYDDIDRRIARHFAAIKDLREDEERLRSDFRPIGGEP